MLKYSTSKRFSPDTTDPKTGARIADPDVYGKVTEDGSFKVSSWPEVRKMYQANQFDEQFKQDARFKKLKPYLEGKTNILTERYDEPYFSLDKKGNIQRNTLTGKMMSPRSDVRLTESEHSSLMKQMKKEHPGYEFGEHERVGVDIGSLKNGKLGKPVSMGSATVASMRSKSKSEAETEGPIPPKKEQIRIVSKIDELLTKLDAGIESLKQVQVLLKKYRQSVLKSVVEGKLTLEFRKQHKDELEPAVIFAPTMA